MKKKQEQGVLEAERKSSDWYKLKLTKNKQ